MDSCYVGEKNNFCLCGSIAIKRTCCQSFTMDANIIVEVFNRYGSYRTRNLYCFLYFR